MKPILLISDTHYHNFTAYSQLNTSGVNTRLADILRATVEAAQALKTAGGDTIIHCGDVFHLRGAISPTVLNPVMEMYAKLIKAGFKVYMISGNHDLETEHASPLASTITALQGIGVTVISEPRVYGIEGVQYGFIPWTKDIPTLKSQISNMATRTSAEYPYVLILHAPLNGVIKGLPDHGLTPTDFDGMPFQHVFCGHYHNHVSFGYAGGAITSVGALTHQSWSDAENLAGYVIYHPDTNQLDHHETNAPQFLRVEFNNLGKLPDAVFVDNYVKVIGGEFTDPDDIATIKEDLILRGAKAVTVEGLTRKPTATRGVTGPSEAPTLDGILSEYIDRTYPGDVDTKSLALGYLRDAAHD